MIRSVVTAVLITVVASSVFAKGFTVSITPKQQTITGITATFWVHVTPTGGFSSSVFLTASCPSLAGASLSVDRVVNSPYTDSARVTFTLTGPKTGGAHDVIITGSNGPVTATDTASLTIPLKTAWTSFTTANSPIPCNSVTTIAFDHSGRAWIGMMCGVARFDGTNWKVFDSTAGYQNPTPYNILKIIVDPSDNVWMCSNTDGILKCQNDSLSVVHIDSIYINYRDIASDHLGHIWVATNHGVYMFNGATWTNYTTTNSNLLTDNVNKIAIDDKDNLYLQGGYGNLSVEMFDGTFWTAFPRQFNNNQFLTPDLFVDPSGSVWDMDHRGAVRFTNGAMKEFMVDTGNGHIAPYEFPGANPYYMAIDAVNDTLVAEQDELSNHPGLAKYYQSGADFYDMSNSGMPNNIIYTMTAKSDTTVWMGIANSGLVILDCRQSGYNKPAVGVSEHTVPSVSSMLGDVYPNPVSGSSMVHYSVAEQTHVRISLVNMLGEERAIVFNGNAGPGQHAARLAINNLAAGMYLLKMKASGGIATTPVSVMR